MAIWRPMEINQIAHTAPYMNLIPTLTRTYTVDCVNTRTLQRLNNIASLSRHATTRMMIFMVYAVYVLYLYIFSYEFVAFTRPSHTQGDMKNEHGSSKDASGALSGPVYHRIF